MQVLGYYDTDGKGPHPYTKPIPVRAIGYRLIDRDGTCWAVLDEEGDWVSPSMRSLGIKAKQHVSED